MESNYDKLNEVWRLKFLELDQIQLMKKFPELQEEGEYLTIRHFGRKYGIHRENGRIIALEDDRPVANEPKMNIYNLMWYAKDYAHFLDKWVPFQDVRSASPFAPAFQKSVLEPMALTFTDKVGALHEAARRIGGKAVPQGDAGYIIPAFACIPMQFLFWDADDEFPAQANILFDYSVTDFIHVESTVALAVEGLIRLAEAADVEIKGRTFFMA